jgi:hypothetical protein
MTLHADKLSNFSLLMSDFSEPRLQAFVIDLRPAQRAIESLCVSREHGYRPSLRYTNCNCASLEEVTQWPGVRWTSSRSKIRNEQLIGCAQ